MPGNWFGRGLKPAAVIANVTAVTAVYRLALVLLIDLRMQGKEGILKLPGMFVTPIFEPS